MPTLGQLGRSWWRGINKFSPYLINLCWRARRLTEKFASTLDYSSRASAHSQRVEGWGKPSPARQRAESRGQPRSAHRRNGRPMGAAEIEPGGGSGNGRRWLLLRGRGTRCAVSLDVRTGASSWRVGPPTTGKCLRPVRGERRACEPHSAVVLSRRGGAKSQQRARWDVAAAAPRSALAKRREAAAGLTSLRGAGQVCRLAGAGANRGSQLLAWAKGSAAGAWLRRDQIPNLAGISNDHC